MSADTHFDAVIVGSGFGGSVMAYRLAEARLRVCLLERGKPYPPGSFPRTPSGMQRSFWDPSEGLYGMFDVWSFSGLEALVSSGLGGGSLIYANVLLRKDERWFVDDDLPGNGHRPWPVTRADLDPHYERVERMMGATPYPFASPPYNATPKTRAMLAAAEKMGRVRDWLLPPLAVTFANAGAAPVPGEPIVGGERNYHHRARSTCRLCGECDVGCNYGSKNTLDYNYLSRAQELGADIRTLCEVRDFAPRHGGGYRVRYVRHDLRLEGEPSDTSRLPLEELTADRLVLAAGTLGSTYLLLKNRDNLPALSRPALGTRFGGNGDLLTFAIGCSERKNGRRRDRDMDPSYGPVITSALRVADSLDGTGDHGRGFYVEDAGMPAFTTWLVEATNAAGLTRRALRFVGRRLRRYLGLRVPAHLSGEMAALLGPGTRSSAALPLLGMGRDVPDGRMTLDDDRLLENDWSTKRSRAVMADMAKAWGADAFRDNPLWYLKRVITVHPLGGCPMGRTPQDGVVDAWGEVFGHPGLFVADGSVLPGPVGANPSLTIGALADRFADHLIERNTASEGRVARRI